MSNIERVEPQNVNGIEMYVSSSGESGVSQTGLARLCGISEMAIRKLLSDRTKTALIQEKDMPTADLYLDLGSNHQAKLIKSEYASKFVAYYAIRSKNKTTIALFSLEKFATRGMDNWIKDCVGYVEQHGNADSKLFDLLAIMGQDIKEMKADLASTSGYRAARITLPGLKEWMESLSKDDKDQLALPGTATESLFTLTEWALEEGYVLTKSQKHALANIVSSTYKLMALELPEKVTRLNDKGQKKMPVQAYPARHFVLLRMCFTKLIASK